LAGDGQGNAARTVQKLLSFGDLPPTMTCTHVLKVAAGDLVSPLDTMRWRME